MRISLRRAVVGFTATISLVLFLPATGASAASCAVTPGSAALYLRSHNVDFDVPSAQYWTLQITDINLSLYDVSGDRNTLAQFDPKRFANADAGRYDVMVKRQNGSNLDSCSGTFSLKRGSSLSLSVAKVTAGRKVSGTLKRVNFGTGTKHWQVLAGQSVAIQYRNKHGVWTTAKTVKTGKKGRFSATVAMGKHRFRAVYAGAATTGARNSTVVTR
jgi:hypothetical protein